MDVTIVVATYGEAWWTALAHRRALPSARRFGVPVIYHHGQTLDEARNTVLDQVTTEYVIHLDADDELEQAYLAAMASGSADLRAPSVRYITPSGQEHRPQVPRVSGHDHACTGECLPVGNWLVIGTMARTQLLREVGGWLPFRWSEDWSLWARCWQSGCTVEAIPLAVYRAHMRPRSRNRSVTGLDRLEAHREIARAHGLPVP